MSTNVYLMFLLINIMYKYKICIKTNFKKYSFKTSSKKIIFLTKIKNTKSFV